MTDAEERLKEMESFTNDLKRTFREWVLPWVRANDAIVNSDPEAQRIMLANIAESMVQTIEEIDNINLKN